MVTGRNCYHFIFCRMFQKLETFPTIPHADTLNISTTIKCLLQKLNTFDGPDGAADPSQTTQQEERGEEQLKSYETRGHNGERAIMGALYSMAIIIKLDSH